MGTKETKKDLAKQMKKARQLAWITIGYLLFDMTILYLTMQNSQAMKASWIEDLLYLIPSISFLIASKVSKKPPNNKFRFGYARAYSIGFVVSAFALLAIGSFLFIESAMKLINREVVTIGSIEIFGETIWFGWLMIIAIGYSILPVYLIGKNKLKLAKKVNIQILYVDAKGQKADWLTSVAVVFGIIGMGFGIWWTDAVAALLVAVDILSDAFRSIKAAISEGMDRTPLNPSLKEEDSIVVRVEELVEEQEWVEKCQVRLRRSGNKTTGDVLVTSSDSDDLQNKISELRDKILNLDWQLTEIVVSPVEEMPILPEKKKI